MGSDFDARATVGCQSAGAPTVKSADLQFAAPADAARGLPNRPAAMRSRGRVSRGRVQPGPKPGRPPPVATARALPLPSAFRRRAKGLPHLATEMVPRRPRLRGWVPRNRQAGPTAPEPAHIGEHIGRAVSDALLSRSARRRRSREANAQSSLCRRAETAAGLAGFSWCLVDSRATVALSLQRSRWPSAPIAQSTIPLAHTWRITTADVRLRPNGVTASDFRSKAHGKFISN